MCPCRATENKLAAYFTRPTAELSYSSPYTQLKPYSQRPWGDTNTWVCTSLPYGMLAGRSAPLPPPRSSAGATTGLRGVVDFDRDCCGAPPRTSPTCLCQWPPGSPMSRDPMARDGQHTCSLGRSSDMNESADVPAASVDKEGTVWLHTISTISSDP